ncbi:Ubiquitin supergroup [Cordyceps militaris]|uniref:Ubiquitin supergroup n=1 Tax=Cordyceps militaris TaxID=73501 RepID=A0A2H4SU93_CORMI|nr:Ubiquitin supergroup [Cordyceps militaris]
MTEVSFAKTFLTSLDSRPANLSPDHVEDARNFPARPPYILPRMPTEMSRPLGGGAHGPAPGQERSVTVTLRSLRNPPLDIKLAAQALGTSLLDVKQAAAARARIPADKLKILYNKRPLPDSKVLSEVLGDDPPTAVVFSLMVIGGAAAVLPEEAAAALEVDDGLSVKAKKGAAAVEQPQFWTDLNGFLMQRVKDEETAAELTTVFKNAWESNKAKP